ncbi:MAG: helicase C-terminal domain-containing protein [Anaerolineae bacterium]
MAQTYVALDLETTGLDPKRDAIIEIGCAKLRDGEIIDQWSTLVNPRRKLHFVITQLTGIADRDLIGQPTIQEVLNPLARFIGDAAIVAHNASFDLGFVRAAGLSFANPVLDTFEVASIVLPGRSSYSLGALAAGFNIDLTHAHRAGDDARATALLLDALQAKAAELPLPTLIEINRLAQQSGWGLRAFFAEAEKRATRTAFLKAYERAALEAGGLEPLLSPAARRTPRFPDELQPLDNREPLDVEQLAAFLEPDGPLERLLPGYEHREPQVEMLRAVADAFNNSEHLLIEAGTGTGKSLAYLLPSLAWAVQNRSRVVVSTNTINLQDQLYTKDIPDLLNVFEAARVQQDSPFQQLAARLAGARVTLMKGRANYLCPRRLDTMRSRTDLSDDELRVLARVLVWLAQTETGDRAELFLWGGREEAIWARLASESNACSDDVCASGQAGRCFFYRNRHESAGAHLVIANHSLLMADANVDNQVLPAYEHVVIDEAHHLEDATTNQMSYTASQPHLERLLRDIYPEGGEGRSGVLYELRRLERLGLAPETRFALEQQALRAQQQTEEVRDLLRQFFNVLGEFLFADQPAPGAYGLRLRLEPKVRNQAGWTQVEIAWDTLAGPLNDLAVALAKLNQDLNDLLTARQSPELESLAAETLTMTSLLNDAQRYIHEAVSDAASGSIYWLEATGDDRSLSLHVAPLHVGPLVEEHLFMKKETVVLTSATLRTAGSYTYIQERLNARDARTATVGSPFDYKNSTLIFVPTDISDPNGPLFQRQVEDTIRALASALEGRTMVLFTAYQQLRQTADALGPGLAAAGITLFQQGSGGSRRQLLENFRTTPRAVLLGTRSFWEGVDVVGAALSGLVLVRLPFAVPNDPIVAARAETFDDAFYHYSVPDAILRFRQGFGRLIRSRQDRGVCLILDNRVLTKRYGQLFLESLPDCTVQRAPMATLPGAARAWLR